MDSIYLRALDMNDLEFTHRWHSDEELYRTLGGPFRFVSKEAEQVWIKSKAEYSKSEINLVICLSETSTPIGLISVRDIDWIARIGYLAGVFIGEKEFQGKDIGSQAMKLMLRHCFFDLGLNRIYANILESNTPSIKMFEKCGYKIEGVLRQHAYKNGKFCNMVMVGICAEDYSQRYDQKG